MTSAKHNGTTAQPAATAYRSLGLARVVPPLGGTTTWADCLAALNDLANPQRLVDGPSIARYERAFALLIGVDYAYGFSSGRVGLYGLLLALGVGPGDEVLLQAPTHIVVANAIRYTGARPVYVDCDLDTYNMDLDQAILKLSERTKVLLLQHTFGIPANIDAALAIARKYGLFVIEDCVHALGATYRGRQVGSFGHAAFFSTEDTKTISTTMGGIVVTNDSKLATRMHEFQSRCAWPSRSLAAGYLVKQMVIHLLFEPHIHRQARSLYSRIGEPHPLPRATSQADLYGFRPTNYAQRLSNAQARMGLRQLAQLEANLAHRRMIAQIYDSFLAGQGRVVPKPPDGAEPAYVRYPVWVDDRDEAVRRAAPHAVLGLWFSSVLEEAAKPACGDYTLGSCPRAESSALHLVNLPTHPRVTPYDAETIAASIADLSLRVRQVEKSAPPQQHREKLR